MSVDPKAPLAKCEGCPLYDEPMVNGDGPDEADIVLVGEAPGKDEVRHGIPFVGKSGRLLNRVLEYHGIEREKVYVTNSVLCRPPGNRTPKVDEVRRCRDRLVAEVKAHKPKKILALGAVAGKNLLQTTDGIKILRMGGPQYSAEFDAHVVPTFHTAAALRNPDLFPSIVGDVRKVTRPIEVTWEPTRYKVANDQNAEFLLKQQLEYADLLALDIENDEPFDQHNPRFLCIGISHKPGTAVVYPVQVLERIKPLMIQGFENNRWIMQNGKYDVQYLWGFGVHNARVDEDTLLMHYSTDERKGTHDLEQLATEVLAAPFYKTEAKSTIGKGSPLSYLDPETLYQYNATDVDVTYRLYEQLLKDMQADGVEEMYRTLLIPGSDALAAMEYRGIRVDVPKLVELETTLEAELQEYEERLSQWVVNPRSPMQVKAVLEAQMGHQVENTTAETLEFIASNYDLPFVDAMLEYRKRHKMFSTYVRGLKKHLIRSRIHSTFLLHGTESGRLSSRRPNLQNIPIDHPSRECFIADEGHVFIEADYAQIELRIAAILSQDPWLLQTFRDGRSIHKEVARELFGPDYTAREYVHAKTVNFGILYDRQAKAIAKDLGISEREAQSMIDKWFRRSPRLLDLRRAIEKDIREKAYLTSYFGRKRRFWLVTRDNISDVFREGYNFPIQSPASDITLSALIQIHQEGQLDIVNAVHDSIMLQVPETDIEDAQVYIKEKMEGANPFDVPIPVDMEANKVWKIKTA